MTEHSNYCDYPVGECVFSKDMQAVHDELKHYRETLANIAEQPNLHGVASEIAKRALQFFGHTVK